jgi:alanyl-tRNA synthetase
MGAVLLSTSSPTFVVVATTDAGSLDANWILRELTARFGGRGGGRAALAQGGGLTGSLEAMKALARTLLA